MSAEALAAAIKALDGLNIKESLSLKTLLDQKIQNQRVLTIGDVVIWTGKSSNRFKLVRNNTRLVVLEMRRTRIVVQHEGSIGKNPFEFDYQPSFICPPDGLVPTGERNEAVKPLAKKRRNRINF